MRDILAERLLAKVMKWSPEDVANERSILEVFALLKYDEYQQFSPGIRFVESLAIWLGQFDTHEEREIAYDFIRKKLIFVSEAEMAHFVAVMYPDFVRPLLLKRAAGKDTKEHFKVVEIANGKRFKCLQEKTLFLALSDGARIDQFRRSNNRVLSHEQIFPSYELSKKHLQALSSCAPASAVVLLDDFTASGLTYLRKEDGQTKGKIAKFLDDIDNIQEGEKIVKFPDTLLIIALYVATEQAIRNIRDKTKCLIKKKFDVDISPHVLSVQKLDDSIKVTPSTEEPFAKLIDKYYDPLFENEHTNRGATKNLNYGFAECGLPLVLHHNTPNNSLFLLWANSKNVRPLNSKNVRPLNSKNVRPLFERLTRHQRES